MEHAGLFGLGVLNEAGSIRQPILDCHFTIIYTSITGPNLGYGLNRHQSFAENGIEDTDALLYKVDRA